MLKEWLIRATEFFVPLFNLMALQPATQTTHWPQSERPTHSGIVWGPRPCALTFSMRKLTKSSTANRVIAVLSVRDLAVVDRVAAAAHVSREVALQQLFRLELAKTAASRTVH